MKKLEFLSYFPIYRSMKLAHSLEKPDLFVYNNYRQYLSDLYDYFKQTKPQFSYRYFSMRAGFQSTNILKLVIDGQRNLKDESIKKFAKGLSLSPKESEFFGLLVFFNQSTKPTEKARFAEKICKILSHRKLSTLEKEQLNYYSNWYNIAVRELVGTQNFHEDPFWITQRLNFDVKPQEIQKSLKSLETLGLLKRNQQGKLEFSESNLNTENEVYSSLVALYHKKMIELAKDSIDNTKREHREISSVCLPVSQTTIQKIKEKIQKFREEILVLASEEENSKEVYQINFQLFPLTKDSTGVKS